MRLRVLAPATVLAVAAVPLLAGSALSADSTIGSLFTPFYGCGDAYTVIQTGSPEANYVVPTKGVITSWRFQTDESATGTRTLKVARFVGGELTITATGTPVAALPDQVNSQPVRVPVLAGDTIGFSYPKGAICGGVTSSDKDTFYAFPGDAAVGTSRDLPAAGLRFPIAATVEPDADGDGFGDTTQDQCATQPATQGACVTPPAPVTTTPVTTDPVVAPRAFTATKTPAAAGKAKVGKKVKVANAQAGNFVPAATKVKVQWFRGATKIKGATKAKYKVARADAGKKLKAKIKVIGTGVPTKTYTVRTKKVTG